MCCGYPLCDKPLSNVPKKMYKISTKENKVYDITDRKNYCSNICYKAGVFLKDQLYTSPLWLRDCEVPVEYKTLSSKQGGTSGSGAEIDLGNTSPVKVSTDHESIFNNTYTDENKEERLKHNSPPSQVCREKLIFEDVKKENSIKCSETMITKTEDNKTTFEKQSDSKKTGTQITNNVNIKKSIKNSSSGKIEKDRVAAQRIKTVYRSSEDIVVEIEKKVKSWFTIDTLIFLLGEDGVKELLKLNGSSLEEVESLRMKDTHMYEKYQEIYRKLNLLELKEKQQESKQLPSKPLPNYNQLQEEAKRLELKVRSFYRGDGKVTFKEEVNAGVEEIPEDQYPVLPLVDHHDVILARRKILLEKLNRVLLDIQNALELSQFRLGLELQLLVATFSLGPSNICLHASQWSLVSLIVIKLLTLRNEILRYAYTKELTQKRLMTFLLTYDLDGGYIDRLASYLVDIEQIGTVAPF
ncbi:putative RNA polymerase II subunit B1 CTD phosphatase RPAP2 isoform X2 [Halyomorpha halys]|nr:putative RNA polymerase II subunit B1 CTD phosphatase RPAP2 isoform X2 [Halyomorpha halys]